MVSTNSRRRSHALVALLQSKVAVMASPRSDSTRPYFGGIRRINAIVAQEVPKEQSELIKDIVPSQINISGIQRVLQLLLAERISIRDLSTILEGIADALAFSRNPATMVEHVRARLARQICAQNTSHNGYLPLIALSARWEQAFAESIVGTGEDRSLAMQPSKLSEFMTATRNAFEQAAREGEAPVLVTSAAIRPFVRSLVERFRAQTTVLSQAEIHPRARLKTVGSV